MRRPRLKPWYQIVIDADAGEAVLRHGETSVVFTGAAALTLLPALAGLLDGHREVEELHATLGEAVRPATEQALHQLGERGLLIDGADHTTITDELSLGAVHDLSSRTDGEVSPQTCLERLTAARVEILGDGVVAAECARLLRMSRITAGIVDERSWSGEADVTVVAPAQGRDGVLGRVNARALDEELTWLQVLPFDGRRASIGPLYVAGQTACYECFRLRRAANAEDPLREEAWDRANAAGNDGWHAPSSPALAAIVAGAATAPLVEAIALREAAGTPMAGLVKTVELGLYGVVVETHRVFRVPRCPACSPLRGSGTPVPWHQPAVTDAGAPT
jgi:bacteriocin biosynthesis cyclodehydratase domain-containing protein